MMVRVTFILVRLVLIVRRGKDSADVDTSWSLQSEREPYQNGQGRSASDREPIKAFTTRPIVLEITEVMRLYAPKRILISAATLDSASTLSKPGVRCQ